MIIQLSSAYSFHQIGGRPNQEDARYPDEDVISVDQRAFAVCDGVGGSERGEVASRTVCSAINNWMKGKSLSQKVFSTSDFQALLDSAYDALDRKARYAGDDMGTTLTFVCFHKGGCMMAHIGDSRIYQIRPEEGIIYRSDDHSLVNSLVHSGAISAEQAINHPQSNVITRCMQPTSNDEERSSATIMNTKDVMANDYFLLCSDGVLHNASDEYLAMLLKQDMTDEEKIMSLKERSATSSDNNTAILIRIKSVELDDKETTDTALESEGASSSTKTVALPYKYNSSAEVSSTHGPKAGIIGWIKSKITKL